MSPTGSPMAEVLHNNLAEIEASDIHCRLGLEKGKYILLSAHREENIDTEKNFLSLFNAINKMAEKYDMPILYSCHPRSRKRLESSGFQLDKRVIQHEPLGFHDYNCLQMNAFAVVSDSGTLPEESSFFTSVGHPFPAVCIRTSTERPEALDKACFILSGIDEKGLLQSVDTAVEMNRAGDYGIPVPDYIEENVSTKVTKRENGEDGLPIPPYAIYNIGNNQPENLLDFVDILQQELVAAGVLPQDYDFEAHKELVPMQSGDVPVTYADTSALERDFGFKPSTSLRDGLRRFAQWYKEFYMKEEK